MSTARLLLGQAHQLHRFLLFDARPDGSLVIVLERAAGEAKSCMTWDSATAQFKPAPARRIHTRLSCHTTGEIRYYSGADTPKSVYFIEPLAHLGGPRQVCFFSIPHVSRLPIAAPELRHGAVETWRVPEDVTGRVGFVVELWPKQPAPTPDSHALILGYELYDVVVKAVPPQSLPFQSGLEEHFIHGVPIFGTMLARAMSVADAEVDFYRRAIGEGLKVLRERSGAYVIVTDVTMRASPILRITFRDATFTCERDESGTPRSHKVRFWIRDNGGRNVKEDLPHQIASIELDAEFQL